MIWHAKARRSALGSRRMRLHDRPPSMRGGLVLVSRLRTSRRAAAGRRGFYPCRQGMRVMCPLPPPLAPCMACRGAIACSCSVILVVKPSCLHCSPIVFDSCRALALPTVPRVLLLFHACLLPLVASPLFLCNMSCLPPPVSVCAAPTADRVFFAADHQPLTHRSSPSHPDVSSR